MSKNRLARTFPNLTLAVPMLMAFALGACTPAENTTPGKPAGTGGAVSSTGGAPATTASGGSVAPSTGGSAGIPSTDGTGGAQSGGSGGATNTGGASSGGNAGSSSGGAPSDGGIAPHDGGSAGATVNPDAKYGHRVLLGSGTGLIAIVSDDGSKMEWQINFKPFGRAGAETEGNDAVMLPNGDIAFTFSAGAAVVKPPDNTVVWRFDNAAGTETQGITPIENGHFMVAETRSGGIANLYELDAKGQKVNTITVNSGLGGGAHQQFRAIRKTPQGTYLVTYLGARKARELDATGKMMREFPCGSFVAVRLPDGNTLISCGSDRRVIEVDPQNNIVWEANMKNVPFMNGFIAGIQRLPNGNTGMCNFFGEMGRDPGTPKCFEITKDFKVVWQLKAPKTSGLDWWTALEFLDPAAWVGGVPLR